MTIQGRIIDIATGQALPGSSILIVNADAEFVGQGVAASNDGTFGLDSTLIDKNLVLVNSTGYDPLLVDPKILAKGTNVDIPLSKQGTNDVETSASLKRKKIVAGAFIGLTVVTAIGLEVRSRRSKAKKIGEVSAASYILPIGALGIGLYVVSAVLNKIGLGGPSKEEQVQAAASEKAKAEQIAAANAIPANSGNYSDNDLKSIAVQLAGTTSGTFFDYENLAKLMAYFAGFRYVDAVKFLGLFASLNGYTLYKWWMDKFSNSTNLNAGYLFPEAEKYSANYKTIGLSNYDITEGLDADQFVRVAISYPYKVAKTSLQ